MAGNIYADTLVIAGSNTLGAKVVPQSRKNLKRSIPIRLSISLRKGSTTGIAAIIDSTA